MESSGYEFGKHDYSIGPGVRTIFKTRRTTGEVLSSQDNVRYVNKTTLAQDSAEHLESEARVQPSPLA